VAAEAAGCRHDARVISPVDLDDARRLALVAAQLWSVAQAVGELAEVEWHSPAADAYRRLVTDIAQDARHLAALLDTEARAAP
jgi:hypothetical protein